jgi:type II secretory pathway component PulJ
MTMMTTLNLPGFVTTFLAVMAALLVFAVGVGILLIAILYLIDITQTQHAIRRNFPVIGRLRYRMEHLGVFFRQYFYAMDREEMPFNGRSAPGSIELRRIWRTPSPLVPLVIYAHSEPSCSRMQPSLRWKLRRTRFPPWLLARTAPSLTTPAVSSTSPL